jgi:hypothetical protein
MSEKSFKKHWNKVHQTEKYAWEFLKRNKCYQKEWKDLQGERRKRAAQFQRCGVREKQKTFDLLHAWLEKSGRDFASKWGLQPGWFPDPQKKYSSLSIGEKRSLNSPSTEPTWVAMSEICLALLNPKDGERIKIMPWVGLNDELTMLTLKIDLQKPWKKTVEEIELVIRNVKKVRESKGLEQKTRMRDDQYKEYLIAYDMRVKGKSWLEIGRKIYPAFAKQVESHGEMFLVQKVKRAYEAAKKMIEGGYKTII